MRWSWVIRLGSLPGLVKARKFIPLLVVAAGLWRITTVSRVHSSLTTRRSILENPTIRHLWPIWPLLSPPATCDGWRSAGHQLSRWRINYVPPAA